MQCLRCQSKIKNFTFYLVLFLSYFGRALSSPFLKTKNIHKLSI
ncbi:hypothetical protein HMP0015_0373 [Acinetobacter haemolyticus ATCC 19194]|uniref:Uncharacterized protein n=1 Tax=Acinetobacter haemolyticus ATCC 19194 TaxID=707232 RepID=D4XKY1_ACIHA|nr:hypothetical protein HMP0015_0373 [Acinetobacter haemolyticus ATCC 19194]